MTMNKTIAVFFTLFLLTSTSAQADTNKFNIGIGSYALVITDQVNTQTFSGAALVAGYIVHEFVSINTHIYSLTDESNQDMNGYDLALRLGKFSPGFIAFAQGGVFSETLSSPTTTATRDFSATFLGFGAGYKWESVSVELDVSRRAIKDYQGTSTADIDAATSSLSVSYLF